MKRIYLSILVTALISLFLLGKFIDSLFDSQYETTEIHEFVTERKFMKGVSRQLATSKAEELIEKLKEVSRLFEVDLSLEEKKELSLSVEIEPYLMTEGLLIDSDNGLQLIYAIENHPDWLLNYQLPNNIDQDKSDSSRLEFWLTILFYVSFCIVLLLWTFPLTKRLSNLNRLASEFGKGELSKRVEMSRFSYIAELEKSFNRMASQIEELLAENKLLAGSISHDLRTPLSCLRFGVDAALETGQLQKKDYYLSRMEQDLSRMESMLEAFLDYASLERKRFELVTTQTDIVKLLKSVVKSCTPLAENEAIVVAFEHQPCSLLNVDPIWITRAISNLLTNAIHHGNQKITVSCRISGRHLQIEVEDDGPGIPEEEANNIFKAFVKLDKSRSKHSRYGLGLAIVARVVNWHNGNISVSRSKRLGGANFSISLPIN